MKKKMLIPLLVVAGVQMATVVWANDESQIIVTEKADVVVGQSAATARLATPAVKQRGFLQGGLSHHKRATKQARILVWGNGAQPDPYVPDVPYYPNPPLNQKIHPVPSNSR